MDLADPTWTEAFHIKYQCHILKIFRIFISDVDIATRTELSRLTNVIDEAKAYLGTQQG